MSGLQIPLNSVWSSMNYAPPRGPCNFKSGIMSGTCPCLRFMLHPVKAATSFECDGCSHHASFHDLENPKEDEILQKWENKQQAAILAAQQQTPAPSAQRAKRKRIADHAQEPGFITDLTTNEEDELLGSGGEATPAKATRGGPATLLRSARKAPTGR